MRKPDKAVRVVANLETRGDEQMAHMKTLVFNDGSLVRPAGEREEITVVTRLGARSIHRRKLVFVNGLLVEIGTEQEEPSPDLEVGLMDAAGVKPSGTERQDYNPIASK